MIKLNKLRSKILISTLFALCTLGLAGQSINDESLESCNHEGVQAPSLTIFNKGPKGKPTESASGKRAVGQYMTEGHVDLLLTTIDAVHFVGKSMRYNIQTNTFEVLGNGKVEYLAGEKIDQFSFFEEGGRKRLFVNVKNFSGQSHRLRGFFEVLEIGQIGLLANDKIVSKKVYSDNGDGLESTETVGVETEYFLSRNTELTPISSFNKRSLGVFNDHSEQIRKFIKEKKLKFKREVDLVTLTRFYAGLIQ